MAKYKYYRRDYGKEKIEKAKEVHNVIAKYNIELLEEFTQLRHIYTYLYKIVNLKLNYLVNFNEYSINRVIGSRVKIGELYVFFGSCRYFSRLFKYGKYNTWNRNINIFTALGLINKHKSDNLNRMVKRRAKRLSREKSKKLNISSDKIKDINFYTIPLYNEEILTKSESVAKRLIENNFRSNSFNKKLLIDTFGEKFANNVFDDGRTVSEYSIYVSKQVEKFILNEIEQNGYTTKYDAINKVHINYKKIHSSEYGFVKNSKGSIIESEFNRAIKQICDKYGLIYKKANKELLVKYSLPGYIHIVYKAT